MMHICSIDPVPGFSCSQRITVLTLGAALRKDVIVNSLKKTNNITNGQCSLLSYNFLCKELHHDLHSQFYF